MNSLHGVMPKWGLSKALKSNHAPMYMKQAQLSIRSTTEENDSASVCLLNLPSHDTAVPVKYTKVIQVVDKGGSRVPAANAASRSSIPKELATPMVNNAKARYWATKDSRSARPL